MYNLSFIDTGNTTLDYLQGVNEHLLDGWMFGGFLLIIYLIVLIASVRTDTDFVAAFTITNFALIIISALAYANELISGWMLMYPIILFVVSIIVLLWRE